MKVRQVSLVRPRDPRVLRFARPAVRDDAEQADRPERGVYWAHWTVNGHAVLYCVDRVGDMRRTEPVPDGREGPAADDAIARMWEFLDAVDSNSDGSQRGSRSWSRVRSLPSPPGTVAIVALDDSDHWLAEFRCRAEDFDEGHIVRLEAYAAQLCGSPLSLLR